MRKNRKKMVTCGAITSKKLALSSAMAELVYWRIYFASDNYGTMPADPWDVLQIALPSKRGVQEIDVIVSLDELIESGLLLRWSVEGVDWIHVLNHDRHQSAEFIRKRGFQASPMPPGWTIKESKGRLIEAGPTPDEGQTNVDEGRTNAGVNDDKAGINGSRSAPSLVTSQPIQSPTIPSELGDDLGGKILELSQLLAGPHTGAVEVWMDKLPLLMTGARSNYSDQVWMDAAAEFGFQQSDPTTRLKSRGKAITSFLWLVDAHAKRTHQSKPDDVVPYKPPPGAEAFRALLAQDEAEGLAS